MPSFEEQMAALEAVVEQLEHGDLPLEESVRLFEQGMQLTASCRKELEVADGRLQLLAERPDGSRRAVDLVLPDSDSARPNGNDGDA